MADISETHQATLKADYDALRERYSASYNLPPYEDLNDEQRDIHRLSYEKLHEVRDEIHEDTVRRPLFIKLVG